MPRIRIEQDYRKLRRAEYPPLADFADATVKGDNAALEEYRQRCLTVKAKFPKPPASPDQGRGQAAGAGRGAKQK